MTKEEAIKKIKEAMPTMWKETKDAVKTLVPELAENEDERIRKGIIAHIQGHLDTQNDFTRRQATGPFSSEEVKFFMDALAWLEKQKETGIRWFKSDDVKNPDKPHIDKAGMFYTTDGRMCYASEIEKQKEQKPILEVFGFKVGDAVRLKDGDGRKHIIKSFEEVEGVHGPNFYHVEFEDNSARDGIYPGEEYPNGYYTQMEKFEEEQKPADYEAELKKCKDNPLYFYDKYVSIKQKSAEWDKLQEVFRNINEAFEDGKKEVVEHPKKYGLCKPTEWSEEDEKIAKEIEEELWYPGDFPDYPSKEESELYDDCQRRLDWFKNKLKFLRPQPKQEWNEDKNKLDKIHSTVQRFIKTIK